MIYLLLVISVGCFATAWLMARSRANIWEKNYQKISLDNATLRWTIYDMRRDAAVLRKDGDDGNA